MPEKIPHDILSFIEKCSTAIAQKKKNDFKKDIVDNFYASVKSPIEILFFCAIKTIIDTNKLEYYVIGDLIYGVEIMPQENIGKYKVDFLIANHGKIKTEYLIVECDGHSFHEKNENKRRYEKKRDRFLQKQGYKIFRFTGSEIVKDPISIAKECLEQIGLKVGDQNEI